VLSVTATEPFVLLSEELEPMFEYWRSKLKELVAVSLDVGHRESQKMQAADLLITLPEETQRQGPKFQTRTPAASSCASRIRCQIFSFYEKPASRFRNVAAGACGLAFGTWTRACRSGAERGKGLRERKKEPRSKDNPAP
jgi:hypothetical protein